MATSISRVNGVAEEHARVAVKLIDGERIRGIERAHCETPFARLGYAPNGVGYLRGVCASTHHRSSVRLESDRFAATSPGRGNITTIQRELERGGIHLRGTRFLDQTCETFVRNGW